MTRGAGLARLEAFRPRMGRAYAATRNDDLGPERRDNVSTLSPWVRRRLVTERELVAAALGEHGPRGAEKFVQEVFWRGYFKGWLEQRPQVWESYRAGLDADLARLGAEPALAARLAEALAGETGIACFDAWVRELRETGYLHNHARMWFASIWIFTLRLPWRIGADLFLAELLDGDAAANTLSWRWVGGLHTAGKVYAARSANIARHTGGRFPATPGLDGDPVALDEGPLPERRPLRRPAPPRPGARRLWLVTEEDCAVETLPGFDAVEVLGVTGVGQRSRAPVSARVRAADRVAVADAVARAGGGALLDAPAPEEVAARARALGVEEVTTACLPRGWVRDWACGLEAALRAEGIALTEVQRRWDALIWPHATAGFFKVKAAIPQILSALGDDPGDLPLFAAAR